MKTDARALLNTKRKNQRNWTNNSKNLTDARQVLQMKYAQKKKHVGPMNRPSANIVRNQLNSGWKIFNQKFKNINPGYNGNNTFVRNNNRFANNRVTGNQSQGFVTRRNFGQFQQNRNWVQMPGRRQNQLSVRDKLFAPSNKQVFTNRNGIVVTKTVSTLQPSRHIVTGDDELEQMTIDDLPGLQGVPRSLLSSKASSSWSSATRRPTFPHMSNDTMVADTVASTSNPVEENPKLVVSNLLSSVSESDIIELFGTFGQLIRVQRINPDKAVIQYTSVGDALLAIETYDGLLLDGQAMHCAMMATYEPRPASLAARLGEKKGSGSALVHIPQQTTPVFPVHAASGSRGFLQNAKDSVRFTVKLP